MVCEPDGLFLSVVVLITVGRVGARIFVTQIIVGRAVDPRNQNPRPYPLIAPMRTPSRK
jgi:hypothetical protein